MRNNEIYNPPLSIAADATRIERAQKRPNVIPDRHGA